MSFGRNRDVCGHKYACDAPGNQQRICQESIEQAGSPHMHGPRGGAKNASCSSSYHDMANKRGRLGSPSLELYHNPSFPCGGPATWSLDSSDEIFEARRHIHRQPSPIGNVGRHVCGGAVGKDFHVANSQFFSPISNCTEELILRSHEDRVIGKLNPNPHARKRFGGNHLPPTSPYQSRVHAQCCVHCDGNRAAAGSAAQASFKHGNTFNDGGNHSRGRRKARKGSPYVEADVHVECCLHGINCPKQRIPAEQSILESTLAQEPLQLRLKNGKHSPINSSSKERRTSQFPQSDLMSPARAHRSRNSQRYSNGLEEQSYDSDVAEGIPCCEFFQPQLSGRKPYSTSVSPRRSRPGSARRRTSVPNTTSRNQSAPRKIKRPLRQEVFSGETEGDQQSIKNASGSKRDRSSAPKVEKDTVNCKLNCCLLLSFIILIIYLFPEYGQAYYY